MDSDSVLQAVLFRYDESLLRAVASRLFKPRNQWPVEELIARTVETLGNPPVIDRRLKDLPPSCRNLLAVVGLTRRWEWPVGCLLELLASMGYSEGLAPLLALLDAGMAFPVLPEAVKSLRDWEGWLGASPTTARLTFPPIVAERATREGTSLVQLASKKFDPKTIHMSDGLEWPLRLGVLWQRLRSDPIRLTQANALFKRDQMRLEEDPLLAAPVADQLVEIPDAGVLAMSMGMSSGLYVAEEGELRAGTFSASWDGGLLTNLAELWSALPGISHWDPIRGYYLLETGEPFATVALPCLLLLAAQPDEVWTHPSDLAGELFAKHPSWSSTVKNAEEAEAWLEAMLLGWAVSLRFVEAAQDGEGWWVRLTAIGRNIFGGGPVPEITNPVTRCLVVQPNGDIIAYRQGLTPGLIDKLSRVADWKMIGPACTLSLSAESVYRGLEAGLMLSDIVSLLQQNSGHPVPANVLDLIRRWAGKRERISVYTAATLLEFGTSEELEVAVGRGLVAHKVTDRIGLVDGEVDYKHFRLLGNRDYEAKPQKCVTFTPDGVTFTVEVAAADLLLEAELARIAEPLSGVATERRFRITPGTAKTVREQGMTLADLDLWSTSRSGEPLSASARLLFASGTNVPCEIRRMLVLSLPNSIVADGVCQWPPTADLLQDRLGPNAVAVAEEDVAELLKRLAEVGVEALLATPPDITRVNGTALG
ncbi:MAG: hypothetical protein EXS09_10735 [Gemmataceae bacterium]|nr:hypothetical protein [Gemmataceae bacterium]